MINIPAMQENRWHQLVVLGNGFDLSCDLQSSFYDYFKPRVRRIEELIVREDSDWPNRLYEDGLTLWDIILFLDKQILTKADDTDWCDVESIISRVIAMRPDAKDDSGIEQNDCANNKQSVTVSNIYASFKGLAQEAKAEKGCGRISLNGCAGSGLVLSQDCGCEFACRFLDTVYARDNWTKAGILGALLSELNRLEDSFKEHLSRLVESTECYEAKAIERYEAILGDGVDGVPLYNRMSTVLSFNYTEYNDLELPFVGPVKVVNVHGALDGEIVFGADGTDCMDDMDAVKFSKTYRVLGMGSLQNAATIAYPEVPTGSGLPVTRIVKFYGHSLARADYSYFQSIFDMLNLYESTVVLCFLYSKYAEDAREKQMLAIARLLSAYGKTLDNRDHGKNLMHKLMIEGRLILKELADRRTDLVVNAR
jgi:hypothetical protein